MQHCVLIKRSPKNAQNRRIGELEIGSKYKRPDGTTYLKDGDGIHTKIERYGSTGAWIANRESEKLDPNEEVEPIVIVSRGRRGPFVHVKISRAESPLTKDTLFAKIGQDWIEHDSLLRSMQQQWTVTDLDLTVLLTELKNSGSIIRERRPAGRRMSFHYKKPK